MNFKHRYLVHTLRTLLGIFMIFSGVSGLLAGPNAANIPEPMIEITQIFWQTGIFQLAKVMETVIGVMLLLKFLPALAIVFLTPLTVGILVFNARVSPTFLPVAGVLALLNIYFIWVYWGTYVPLFGRKT